MSTAKRNVTNVGSPITDLNGKPIVGTRLIFTLVDEDGNKVSVTDSTTGSTVCGEVSVWTDSNGEFSVDLFPNDKGNSTSQYRVKSVAGVFKPFNSVINYDTTPLTWSAFVDSSGVILPPEPDIIQNIITNVEYLLTDLDDGNVGDGVIDGGDF